MCQLVQETTLDFLVKVAERGAEKLIKDSNSKKSLYTAKVGGLSNDTKYL